MRVAVVGCGYWGSKHLRVLRELPAVGEIAAVDGDLDRGEALARTFPRVRPYLSLEDALPDVDAVVIATPPSSHAKLALLAIEAGKHVLVEKPLTTCEDDARMLIEAAEEAGVTLMAGHTFEFNSAVRYLRDTIADGQLGRLFYLNSQRLNLGMYRPDVNVVWDLAAHDISIANYLLGDTPTAVRAWGSSHAHRSVQDVAFLNLEYGELGIDVQVHVSWLDPRKVRQLTVVGSSKMAVYDDLATDERVRIYDKGVTAEDEAGHGVPMSYRYGGIDSPYIPFEEPLLVQNRHFLECALSGETPLVDGQNGLAVVRVLEAVEKAMRSGRPIQVKQERRLAVCSDAV